MASTQTNISKGILLTLIVGICMVFYMYSFPASNRESIKYSSTQCVRSVCVENKTTGDMCSISEPKVSEVLIESDVTNSNIRNIRVIPSDDRCQ